jgi:hypothetical protein
LQAVGLLIAALLLVWLGYYVAVLLALVLVAWAVWRLISFFRHR